MDEVTESLNSFKEMVGRPIVVDRNFTIAVLNALWTIVSGKRFPQSDDRLHNLLKNSTGYVHYSPSK
jgi:hypothetical protein